MLAFHLRVAAAAGFLIFAPSAADAAAFKAAYAACQDKAVFKKALTFPGDKEGKKAGEFLKGRIDAHECLLFTRGQQVSVDERDGNLWCVRRSRRPRLLLDHRQGGRPQPAADLGWRRGKRPVRREEGAALAGFSENKRGDLAAYPPLPARGEMERRAPVTRPGADRPPGAAPARGRARARGPAPPAPPWRDSRARQNLFAAGRRRGWRD